MNILLTALSLATLVGCFLALTRAQRASDRAIDAERSADKKAMLLLSERNRIMSVERELATLTREVRKLSGKFHATLREQEAAPPDVPPHEQPIDAPFCENYSRAQSEGPQSAAARCDCNYCKGRRAMKELFRARQREAGHLNPQWVRDHSTGTGNHGE